MHRFVLGTVQMGLPYGALADTALMSISRAEAILDTAWDAGIRAFDTAEAYGCATERLASWLRRGGRLRQAHVVTKVSFDRQSIDRLVSEALDRFDGAASRTVLSHGFIARDAWEALSDAALHRGAGAGQSVYEPDEVRHAISFPCTARVQAPGNIFDDRARAARGGSPVPLDLRSVYLQGILLLTPEDASRRVRGADALARAVSGAATRAGGAPSELLLASALRRLAPADRVVIGADTPEQVASLSAAVRLAADCSSQLEAFDREVRRLLPEPVPELLLDPRQWNR